MRAHERGTARTLTEAESKTILAAAGLGSRRHCEELILTGRVQVDGQTASELGSKADPRRQTISVDGQPLPKPRAVYFMVNKPTGVVSTNTSGSRGVTV